MAPPVEEKKEGEDEEAQAAAGGMASLTGEKSGDRVFGEGDVHTSVKVRAPPGGASSITF